MCCNTIPRKLMLTLAAFGVVLGVGRLATTYADHHEEAEAGEDQAAETPAVLNHTVKDIHGNDIDLSKYYGDVVLIVNVASKCGLTPQYEQLEAMHDQYAKQGLSILGFPANNFNGQEPGTNEQILEFCEATFGVEFDMFAKLSVAGDDQAPLYAFLTSEETNPEFAGPIRWNFDKFLVSRTGEVVARFEPRTKPDAEAVVKAIKAELAKPVPADAQRDEDAEDADENVG